MDKIPYSTNRSVSILDSLTQTVSVVMIFQVSYQSPKMILLSQMANERQYSFLKEFETIANIKDMILTFFPHNLVYLSGAEEDSYNWQHVVGHNTSIQVLIPILLNPRKTTSRCWAVDSGMDFFSSVF